MNILVIASLLPIPGLIHENDYVFKLIHYYQKNYPDDRFMFIRPITHKLTNFPKSNTLTQKIRKAAINKGDYKYNGDEIQIWPYYSIGRYSFLHSILSISILLQIKKRLTLLKDFKPDLIHAHYLFPDGLLAKYLAKILNLSYILTLQEETRFILNTASFYQSKKILNRASFITTLNPKMKLILERKGYKGVQLLLPGIDDSFFQQEKQPKTDQIFRFVTAAHLVPIKNIDAVIKAMSLLRHHDEITYTIIGDGPEKVRLIELTEQLNLTTKINFLSPVPNELLASKLVQYDVYIQPSFKESLGLSYFEALACELPVILTENTGAFDLIKGYNVHLTVNPFDINDIADKITIYSNNEVINSLHSLCKNASRIATWANTISLSHNIYNKSIKSQ
jgi:glycosyltransferase involved in cell wall biosynthesis